MKRWGRCRAVQLGRMGDTRVQELSLPFTEPRPEGGAERPSAVYGRGLRALK